ncbi:MAG: quinolinate synthase NadA [Synergistaceae bacterium]|nr:quinolinate synthase NadA [Synergistaceae bacterium]
MTDVKEKILELKKERDAAILAHYYVPGEVQEIADQVGDSYYLSVIASQIKEKVILFCGVSFMAESVKIMNPDKTVLMPDTGAECPMVRMVSADDIKKVRDRYKDLAVVCYINSTSEVKAHSDVCVTSSNALKVVRSMPEKNIFFIPDENLGRYVASETPGKNFIFNDGFCSVHADIKREDVVKLKAEHPSAKVAAHPECREEIRDLSDYVGSTSGIIDYVEKSCSEEFIVCTERGIFHKLAKRAAGKKLYSPALCTLCTSMKKNTTENLLNALMYPGHEITVDKQLALKAVRPLQKMLRLAQSE